MGCWFSENSRYSPDIQSAHSQQGALNPQSFPIATFFPVTQHNFKRLHLSTDIFDGRSNNVLF